MFTRSSSISSAFVSVSPSSTIRRKSRKAVCAVMDQERTSTMKYSPEHFVRSELKKMDAYTPILPYEVLAEQLGRAPEDIVKLDANENPYGPCPKVSHVLAKAPYLHIYPDPESAFLRDALAKYTSVPKEYLMAGAGADELIDLLFRLMITPGSGQSVVNFPPTFGMYKFDADVNGAEIISIPRDASDFSINVEQVEALFKGHDQSRYPRIIFVASPNNPDGSLISDDVLKRLLRLPTLVVLDEAYFEFSNVDRIQWVLDYDNLVVLRTFSKWAGLAGLRVGYGAFPISIIKHLWKIKQPYNVSVAAQLAAQASIGDKEDLLAKVQKLIEARKDLYINLKRYSWLKPYPSQSNFVLCRVTEGRTAFDVKRQLAKRGVLIRYYTTAGLEDCIRISMGTVEQMKVLYAALDEL